MNWSKEEVIQAVRRQRARTVALCKSFGDKEWETPALPGWTVKHVIAHLVSSDSGGMTGKLLLLSFKKQTDGGLSNVEAWNEREVKRWVGRPPRVLVKSLGDWGRRIERLLRVAPKKVLNMRAPLPFGRAPVKLLGIVRVFDEWVHEQDIRRALGRDPETDRDAVRDAARAMLEIAPLQTPSRIPDEATGTVLLRFREIDVPALRADLATKTFEVGERPADATVTTDPAAIMMIASGRDAWADAERDGLLAIEGDRIVAEAFLAALKAA